MDRSLRKLGWGAALLCSTIASTVFAQAPAQPKGVKTIHSPDGVQIRYKEPTFCEMTPGVKTYAGYVDLDASTHIYFLFYESRRSPKSDPVTLWLNGGPGSDSLLGAFIENGPCFVTTPDLKPTFNQYSWNNVSNMLYLSQPVGTGFSYSQMAPGTLDDFGNYQPPSVNGIDGEYSIVNATDIDTTHKAAVATWHILQAFFENLPHLDPEEDKKAFHLFTESYGGHYGPEFYYYFYNQSQAIDSGKTRGTKLNVETLGIGNGIYDYKTQGPYYIDYAINNTYGIVAYNETVLEVTQFLLPECLEDIDECRQTRDESVIDHSICADAEDFCRDNIEGAYYEYANLDAYDVRQNGTADVPPQNPLAAFLNQAPIQDAMGVALNWTGANQIASAFNLVGDEVYTNTIPDMADLLDKGVRITMYHGDADYICNWFGGEAVSLAIPYAQQANFKKAGYAPFLFDGKEVGAVRQYGNFSFVRVYYSGHTVPYYVPGPALAIFNRTINGADIATGEVAVTADYSTVGNATSTFRED